MYHEHNIASFSLPLSSFCIFYKDYKSQFPSDFKSKYQYRKILGDIFSNIHKTIVNTYVIISTLNIFQICLMVISTYILSGNFLNWLTVMIVDVIYLDKRVECLRKQRASSGLSKQEIMELMMLSFLWTRTLSCGMSLL